MAFEKDYPRDMTGYGARPPDADWPQGARVAVQFVLNYEEGGENNILHGDPHSEAFLSEIVGAQNWPGQRHWNMESIYEYGARAGFWRVRRLFEERGLPLTVFGVAHAMARAPEQVKAMLESGWEIASHGLKWIEFKDMPEAEERAQIAEAIRLQTALTGARPLGFYQGRASMNTVRLGMEEGGFLYLSDCYDDDLPHWRHGPGGAQLMIPYTLDANDMRFAAIQGFNSGDQFFAYLRDSFDMLLEEGRAGSAKMMSVGLHCRLVGRPGRAAALARFLDYVASTPDAWVATRLDIARHWARRHPPTGLKPSGMSRALFVELYGDVYEHTPQIAEAAHRAGLTAGQDTADGLAAAMATQMRAMGEPAQLVLINAHPDLAGKLAAAGELTADSTAEQASSGLDRLTAEERARFTALNEAYKARFGFPFIMAVKGARKDDILAAFERRLAHDRAQEFAEALTQIEKIATLRLRSRLA